MISAFIHYEQSEIHYLHSGNGSKTVVCLHGYGEDASSFFPLIDNIENDFFLIAIDLPFHGDTKWNQQRSFTIKDLSVILDEIIHSLKINQQHFLLLGYSMGGRIALTLLQYMPERVSKIILIAPDGLQINSWYWFATQTYLGNSIFRFTMHKPGFFLKLLNFANRFKLINKSVLKFINSYVENKDIRNQLYVRWTCMRKFKPDLTKVRSIINQKQLHVRMLYGKHDRIILAKRAEQFRQGIGGLCELHVIDSGHQLLQPKHKGIIIQLLTT